MIIYKDPLKHPKTEIQTILYLLLTDGYVSCISAPYMHGFRTRISELKLKHNIRLESINTDSINRFGNKFYYAVHKIHENSKEDALCLYLKLTEK